MGISKVSFGLVFLGLAMAILASNVVAQPASSPSPSADCTIVIAELIDCLPFASGDVPRPPATCCSNLTVVIANDPICLCQLLNTSFIDPSTFNLTRAEQLPTFCNVSPPDPTLCSAFPRPGPVAAPGPLSSAPTPSGTAPTPSASTPSPSSPSGTPSAVPLPSTPSAGPIGVPPVVNTTGPPAPLPNSASVLAFSFSAVALLLVHLIVH